MKSPARSTVNVSRAREESDVRVQMQHRWRRRKLVRTEPEEFSSGVLEQTYRSLPSILTCCIASFKDVLNIIGKERYWKYIRPGLHTCQGMGE
ncbi:hypothetical protein MHYP_G00160980 [Metynnis hypsauchen]